MTFTERQLAKALANTLYHMYREQDEYARLAEDEWMIPTAKLTYSEPWDLLKLSAMERETASHAEMLLGQALSLQSALAQFRADHPARTA